MNSKALSFQVFSVLFVALFTTFANAAPANNKEPVQVKLEQLKVVVDNNGKEVLAAATQVKPGEVIEYRATYTNVSARSISNLVATLPVPKNTEYQVKTAMPLSTAEATIDNVTFSAVPLINTATKQPIPTKQYRALRWKLQELAASKSVVVSARMKVTQE